MKKYILTIKGHRYLVDPSRVLIWAAGVILIIIMLVFATNDITDSIGSIGSSASADPKNYEFPGYKSKVDKDGDGIDDQTDMLKSARAYIATKPKYKSIYYAGGYPTDNHGVCTDVIAFAMLNSGYDIRTLLNEDAKERPDLYPDIKTLDIDIDFRRVDNLNVYFSRHAITCTTDLDDKGAWKGGDIVVFKHHIGMISDKRNEDGYPYLIHLSKPGQKVYEQRYGLVKRRADIVAHYRIS